MFARRPSEGSSVLYGLACVAHARRAEKETVMSASTSPSIDPDNHITDITRDLAADCAGAGLDKLRTAMRECEPDRKALINEDLEHLFKQVWAEALACLETALPEFQKIGTNDAKLHRLLRGRILHVGNAKVRELSQILAKYYIQRVFQRKVTTYVTATHGIHKLPLGVEMPPEKEQVNAA
jgi:hypothetical protein